MRDFYVYNQNEMNNTKKYVILFGIALGYSISVSFLDGGYDALVFYLKPPFPSEFHVTGILPPTILISY